MLGFLRRYLKTASRTTKLRAYSSLVRPHVEYCDTVWSPNTVTDIQKVEKTQRRAARFILDDFGNRSSVTDMLKKLDLESLESRRAKHQLTMFYKIVHGLVDIPSAPYLSPGSSKTRSSHSLKFRQSQTSTNTFKYSFFPRTIPSWNSLPRSVAEAPSLDTFKRELASLKF